jgi:hypothetical protein
MGAPAVRGEPLRFGGRPDGELVITGTAGRDAEQTMAPLVVRVEADRGRCGGVCVLMAARGNMGVGEQPE